MITAGDTDRRLAILIGSSNHICHVEIKLEPAFGFSWVELLQNEHRMIEWQGKQSAASAGGVQGLMRT